MNATAAPPTLSVVAPCFNEEPVLPEFVRRARAACEKTGLPFEIILVDDGSRDRTWALIAEAAKADPRIRGLRLLRNHGHQLALTAGLEAARGDRVLAIDADLQDPPELVGAMLDVMAAENADVVYGQRRRRDGETAFKRWTAHLFYRLIRRLSDVEIPADTGDFRLMRRGIVDIFCQMPEPHRFVRGMIAWIGGRQVPLLYDRDPRYAGETKYPWPRMIRFASDALTGFSRRPLAIATYVGGTLALISIGLGLWSIVAYFTTDTTQGWTSIMAAIGLVAAMQFIFLGVIGAYIGRLYESSRGRPLFIVATTTGRGLAMEEPTRGPHLVASQQQ